MFNMNAPLSAFSKGDYNAASYAIAQRVQNMENAVSYLIDLYEDDVKALENEDTFQFVLKKYHLSDLSAFEEQYIIDHVLAAIEV